MSLQKGNDRLWESVLIHLSFSALQQKRRLSFRRASFCIAEREGFEPPVPLGTAVFKTAVIDHSTTFPWCDLGGARTLDPMIKSHLLYQLSYQVIIFKRSL